MVRKSAWPCLLLVICLASFLPVAYSAPSALASPMLPVPGAARSQSCQGYWYVSYGGVSSYTLLNIDPDNTSIEELRFDHGYSDPYASAGGFLDFDGDLKSDVFSLEPRPDGLYQWRYSSGGASPWIDDMAYDGRTLSDLRFGFFSGNNRSDVFGWRALSDGSYRWMVSADGYGSWQDLANAYEFPWTLGFGDFNGDAVTDVFAARDVGPGQYHWIFSSGGVGSYQAFLSDPAATMPYGPTDIRFGDSLGLFGDPQPEQADGRTDVVFISDANLGGYPAFAWSSPNYQYNSTQGQEPDLNKILLGDFNGDRSTDIFYVALRSDGFYQWYYLPFGRNDPVALAYASAPISDLRLGDFNGDGLSDVLTVVHSCEIFLPTMIRK